MRRWKGVLVVRCVGPDSCVGGVASLAKGYLPVCGIISCFVTEVMLYEFTVVEAACSTRVDVCGLKVFSEGGFLFKCGVVLEDVLQEDGCVWLLESGLCVVAIAMLCVLHPTTGHMLTRVLRVAAYGLHRMRQGRSRCH
eukprot:6347377-Ditylum_brightwellii.AAC.1